MSRRAPWDRFWLVRIFLLPSIRSTSHRYLLHDLDIFATCSSPRVPWVGCGSHPSRSEPGTWMVDSRVSSRMGGRGGVEATRILGLGKEEMDRTGLVPSCRMSSTLAVEGSDQTSMDLVRLVPRATLSLVLDRRPRVRRARMVTRSEGEAWTVSCRIWWWERGEQCQQGIRSLHRTCG